MKKIIILLNLLCLTSCNSLILNHGSLLESYCYDIQRLSSLEDSGNYINNKYYNTTNKKFDFKKFNKNLKAYVNIGDIIYVLDKSNEVFAFSIKENKVLNKYKIRGTKANSLECGISYSNKKLFISNGSKFLIILDENLQEVCRKKFPGIISHKPIPLENGNVLVQLLENKLFLYNFNNQKCLWDSSSISNYSALQMNIQPIIYEHNVIVFYNSGEIVSIDIDTGTTNWSFNLLDSNDHILHKLNNDFFYEKQPVLDNHYLYIIHNNTLIKFNLLIGTYEWKLNIKYINFVNVCDKYLTVTTTTSDVLIIDSVDSKILWKSHVNNDSRYSNYIFSDLVRHKNYYMLYIINDLGILYSIQIMGNNKCLLHKKVMNYYNKIKSIHFNPDNNKLLMFSNKNVIFSK